MQLRAKLTVIGVSVAVLAAVVAAALVWQPWSRGALNAAVGSAPAAVRTLRGPEEDPLQRPVGILATGGRVYVVDAQRGVVDELSPGGHHYRTWGRDLLKTPVAIARNPRTGDFYVADRGLEAMVVFGDDGTPKGTFAPEVPSSASWTTSPAALWAPVGLDFASDGSLYVIDARTRHRLLVFGPDGRFQAEGVTGASGGLDFPGGVVLRGEEVWVADSNGQRLVVFDLSGRLVRTMASPGLPRGLCSAPGATGASTLLVADTLAHRISERDEKTGRERGSFGTRGFGESQFSYPNAVSSDGEDLVFVADTGNARVAVWSWSGRAGSLVGNSWWWALVAVPFLPLLALPFVLKRPLYFVTDDFVRALWEAGDIESMTGTRAKWECLPEDFGRLQIFEREGGPIMVMLRPVSGSESDAAALREHYHLDEREAAVLSAARGAKALLTEDGELLRVAHLAGVNAQDHAVFAQRTGSGRGEDSRP